jgi:hypothetical protein
VCCLWCLCGFERSDLDKLLRTIRTAGTATNMAITGEFPLCGIKIPSKAVQDLSAKIGTKLGKEAAKKVGAAATGVGLVIWAYDIGACAIKCWGELSESETLTVTPGGPTVTPGGPTVTPAGATATTEGPVARGGGPSVAPGGPAVKPGGPSVGKGGPSVR